MTSRSYYAVYTSLVELQRDSGLDAETRAHADCIMLKVLSLLDSFILAVFASCNG